MEKFTFCHRNNIFVACILETLTTLPIIILLFFFNNFFINCLGLCLIALTFLNIQDWMTVPRTTEIDVASEKIILKDSTWKKKPRIIDIKSFSAVYCAWNDSSYTIGLINKKGEESGAIIYSNDKEKIREICQLLSGHFNLKNLCEI